MLDVSIRTELLRLMLDLRRERGLTYLFITHDLAVAWVIADRIAVMYLGRIMEIGPAEQVIRRPRNPYTQALVSVSPSPDPPERRRASEADDPGRRDARCGARPPGLPVPPALPAGVRPVQGRRAAAVRGRGGAPGRLLAGMREGPLDLPVIDAVAGREGDHLIEDSAGLAPGLRASGCDQAADASGIASSSASSSLTSHVRGNPWCPWRRRAGRAGGRTGSPRTASGRMPG